MSQALADSFADSFAGSLTGLYERKLYQRLLEWKTDSHGETALLIEGARRVGKTTLAKEFARKEYRSSLYIDFGHVDRQVLDIFSSQRGDTTTLLRTLQLYFGVDLFERESLVIFDEVQRFPLAREEIKHLVADGRFDYLETGSLISIRKNSEGIIIPSEEESVRLNPLDFEEYLWAIGRRSLADEIRRCRKALEPLPRSLHDLAMRLFSEYMLVGGMPKAVAAFVDTGDFGKCDREKRLILRLYDEDIQKFGGSCAGKARGIWRQIPGQLSANSKRFKLSSVSKSARYRNYEAAMNWLEDSHTVNVCRRCTDPNVGFKMTEDEGFFKCYMADTGLLVSHAFSDGSDVRAIYRDLQLGRVSVNKGMIVENVVAQQIRASGRELFYFSWEEPAPSKSTRPRPREIDFLITRGFSDAAGKLRVCPVEVKSSKNYSTISLDDFKKRWSKRVGDEIVLHPKQLSVDGHRVFLPLYMSFCL